MLSRRKLIVSASAVVAACTSVRTFAADQVIKVGTLKLMHAITPHFYEKFAPAGYKIEVFPFETPADGKYAVVTKSVDFGAFG